MKQRPFWLFLFWLFLVIGFSNINSSYAKLGDYHCTGMLGDRNCWSSSLNDAPRTIFCSNENNCVFESCNRLQQRVKYINENKKIYGEIPLETKGDYLYHSAVSFSCKEPTCSKEWIKKSYCKIFRVPDYPVSCPGKNYCDDLVAIAKGDGKIALYMCFYDEIGSVQDSNIKKNENIQNQPINHSGKKKKAKKDAKISKDTNSTAETLTQKMNRVSVLLDQLRNNLNQATTAKANFQTEIEALKSEIRQGKQRIGTDTFERATKNTRINNNLLLIQRQTAYIEKIEELEVKYKKGIEEMVYLERQGAADLKMVRLLGNKDEIVKKIDKIIKNYSSYSRYAIDESQLRLKSLRQIWKEI
jgi:hypothetical protein